MRQISKEACPFGFKEAHKAAITEATTKSGFRSTGLAPFDLGRVLSRQPLTLRTPTPPSSSERMWAPKTPTNLKELELQRTLVKEKIHLHQDSSPTPIHEAVDEIVSFAHHVDSIMVLSIETEKALQEANAQNNTRKPTFINVNPVMDREMVPDYIRAD
jgi:hypothetical protein